MVTPMLGRKLRRDMSRQVMQFLSIILLCTLGTFAYAVLDGIARMADVTVETYFEENNLADYWVTLPEADRTALSRMRSLPGIREVTARAQADLETTLSADVNVSVTAYDGPMDINRPYLIEGSALDGSDLRGCLLQRDFARAHALSVGDRLGVRLGGEDIAFVVRGIVTSPEFVIVSESIAADPEAYGYILINARALPALPLTQIIATAQKDADRDALRALIEQAFPRALVVDRRSHSSTVRVRNDAQMFKNMTLIFPILAYFIACMIVMTTLSRMIDAQRLQIGTLKALGFPPRKIRGHYLSYAVVPALTGALIGLFVGHTTLPHVLWNTLMSECDLPYQLDPPISLPAWAMVALTVALAAGICWFSYHKAARETPAALLRPKPPKDGQRILLERIPPLWRRLGFNAKTVARNLLRSKLRSFMFFLGILFCNMLLIASFGLQDSVKRLTYEHYGEVLHYDALVRLSGTVGTAESYERRIAAGAVECLMERSVTLRSVSGERTTVLTVLGDGQQLQRLGKGASLLELPEGGAAVTEKLCEVLGLSPGDEILLNFPGDDESVTLRIGAVACNSFSQGVYLNRTTWERLRKGPFTPTAVQLLDPAEGTAERLLAMDEVERIDYPSVQIAETLRMLDSLSTIFAVLEGIALALAFVICWNMGLMNFAERLREYATLKVLGYHQREIRNLILSENLILTLLGTAAGIYPGVLLTFAIMRVCESETVRYTAYPDLRSVLIASAITFGFSFVLQLLQTRRVRSIDMVEALKSVE